MVIQNRELHYDKKFSRSEGLKVVNIAELIFAIRYFWKIRGINFRDSMILESFANLIFALNHFLE